MKKLLVLIVIAFSLAACMPELPQPIAPMEEANVEVSVSQPTEIVGPSGSYIIIRHYTTEPINGRQIFVDLYFNSNVVCTWDMGMNNPLNWEDEVLYFTPLEGNCPDMDPRNGTVWHLQENWAEIIFKSASIQEIPVWNMVGSQLFLLEDKR